jgi:hypothetical protein
MGIVDTVVRTFGPFLIPIVIFGVGIGFYVLLWLLGRRGFEF